MTRPKRQSYRSEYQRKMAEAREYLRMKPGESMDEYRERVKQGLRILNEEGEAK